MEKRDLIYERRSKHIYSTEDPFKVIMNFEDSASAFSNVKKATIAGKGACNNAICSMLFKYLALNGVPNHFVRVISDREQLCRKVEVIPLEIVVRNVSAGSMCRRLMIPWGKVFNEPVVEIKYKDRSLAYPLINGTHAVALGIVTKDEFSYIYDTTMKVNTLLASLFTQAGITLVDFQIEFGRTVDGEILLSDEIDPDTCRLWDKESGESLDLDRFRMDMGGVQDAFKTVRDRISSIVK